MEPGRPETCTCEWWDGLLAAEPPLVLEAHARLAWFGLGTGAPPLLAARQASA